MFHGVAFFNYTATSGSTWRGQAVLHELDHAHGAKAAGRRYAHLANYAQL